MRSGRSGRSGSAVEKATHWLSLVCGYILLAVAFDMSYGIFMRKIGSAQSWTLEVAADLTTWAIFLALGSTYHVGQHVSLDVVEQLARGSLRLWMRRVSNFVSFAFAGVFLWGSYLYLTQQYFDKVVDPNLFRIPTWPVNVMIAAGCLGLVLATIRRMFAKKDADEEDGGLAEWM